MKSVTPKLSTRLSHSGRPDASKGSALVNPGVFRGSTVIAPSVAERRKAAGKRFEQSLVYGRYGTETHHALENLISTVEGGTNTQVVSSGLAACTTALLAFLGSGDHCLIPDTCYGPVRNFCDTTLVRLGVSTTYYGPEIGAGDLKALIRPSTRVLYVESPGTHTFEVQDVPALAAEAHAHGLKVLMDNTWGIAYFQPFDHGVDVSIQALTKYASGHSDVLLGSVTTKSPENWQAVRELALSIGQYASPDDCWLTIRGLRTLTVRIEKQMAAGIEVARWFAGRDEVLEVRHPALPDCPGHELWKRDFTGAASLFGVVFKRHITPEQVDRLVDSLSFFGLGSSWGGYESLAIPIQNAYARTAGKMLEGAAMRIHIGLEDPSDLIADLEKGFATLTA